VTIFLLLQQRFIFAPSILYNIKLNFIISTTYVVMEVSIYIYIHIYLSRHWVSAVVTVDTDLLLMVCLYCDVLDLSRFLSDIGQPDLLPVAQQAEQPVHVATTIRRAIGVPHAVADALPCPWSCRAGDGHRCWFTLCGERQAEILRDALLTPPEHLFTQPAAAPSRPQPDQVISRLGRLSEGHDAYTT